MRLSLYEHKIRHITYASEKCVPAFRLLLKLTSSIIGHFSDPNFINLKTSILGMLMDTQFIQYPVNF